MFGAITQPNEITLLIHSAIVFNKLAFKNEKLLMPIVTVRARGHARRHAVDVKAVAKRLIRIQLQDTVAQRRAVVKDKRPELGLVNIRDLAIAGSDGFHVWRGQQLGGVHHG